MSLSHKIEKYLGRKVNFLEEVILASHLDQESIVEWNADEEQPLIEELNAIDTSNEEALIEVQLNRARAYPSIAEQLDMQYHDSVNGTTTWADAIAAVKAEYPKP